MFDALHLVAVLPAGIGLGCAIADRRSRARAALPAALGFAAMLDLAAGWRVLPAVVWAGMLVVAAVLLAVAGRRAGGGPAHAGAMRLHRAIGMLVSAVLVLAMIPGGGAPVPAGHAHGGGFEPIALLAAAAYVGWSLILVAARRPEGAAPLVVRVEQGAMAAMTAGCAVMPLLA